MKTGMVLGAVLALASPAFADEGEDTLRFYLAKSDLVILAKIASAPKRASEEVGGVYYSCDFQIAEVLRGQKPAEDTIRVTIARFEREEADRLPAKAIYSSEQSSSQTISSRSNHEDLSTVLRRIQYHKVSSPSSAKAGIARARTVPRTIPAFMNNASAKLALAPGFRTAQGAPMPEPYTRRHWVSPGLPLAHVGNLRTAPQENTSIGNGPFSRVEDPKTARSMDC